jgi:Uma2 family endonuclease
MASVRPEGQLLGQLTARLTWRLAQFVEETGLGSVYAAETGFQLSKAGRVRSADLAFVSRERLDLGKKAGAPDLVAEVVSRTSGATTTRVSDWLAGGTRVVLVLDSSAKTLTVHRRSGAETLTPESYLTLPDVVPGWSLRVGDLFD